MNAGINLQTQKTTAAPSSVILDPSTIETKQNNYGISVGAGYFFSDRFFAGIRVGYSKLNQKQTQTGINSYTTELNQELIPLTAEFKWYKKLSNRFYYNLNGSFTYTPETATETTTFQGPSSTITSKGHSVAVRISPLQVTYALSHKFLVEAGFGYVEYASEEIKTTYPSGSSPTGYTQKAHGANINISPIVSSFTFTYVFR